MQSVLSYHPLVAYSLTRLLTYCSPYLTHTQFFGHGDPAFPTSARHQIHIQFEKDDGILGIIKDSGDVDRYTRDCMKKWCPSEEYIQENPSCYKWWFNTTETNPVPQSVSESARGRGGLGERMAPKGTGLPSAAPAPAQRTDTCLRYACPCCCGAVTSSFRHAGCVRLLQVARSLRGWHEHLR